MELKNKQENFLSLILSAFCLGIEISLIASIIFTLLYENNKILFTISVIVITLINFVLILFINAKYCKLRHTFELPIVFDAQKNKFIDIPHCPASVNARILFDSLSNKQKSLITCDAPLENMEYISFCISFIGQLIFSRIFWNSSHILGEKTGYPINREFFKDLLVKYKYINIDDILNKPFTEDSLPLQLPKGIKISHVTNNEIVLKSLQGYIHIYWDITTTFPCEDNIALFAKSGNISTGNCFSTVIKVTLDYGYNVFYLFKKKTQILDYYFTECKNQLESFDINNSMQKLQLQISSLNIDLIRHLSK